MSTTKKYNPGDTICTCRVGEDRYEIKKAVLNKLGSGRCYAGNTDCTFLFDARDCPEELENLCVKHDVFFIKIQAKEQQ